MKVESTEPVSKDWNRIKEFRTDEQIIASRG